jgi:hypothetical protein
MIFSFSRIVTAEKSPNDSAQSPGEDERRHPHEPLAHVARVLVVRPLRLLLGRDRPPGRR